MTLYKDICGERIPLTAEEEAQYFLSQEESCIKKEDWAWDSLRMERNKRLLDCDWCVLPDVDLSPAEIEEALIYRQALRDLPENTEIPCSPQWPDIPSFINYDY